MDDPCDPCLRPGARVGASVGVPTYDAIIVGAGPAGSTCAYRLATAGASVLLLDRARFPRDKPCGGAVTARALRELPVEIDDVVERVVSRFELRLRHRGGFSRAATVPLAYMTQRRRNNTDAPEVASRYAHVEPAGPAPTTIASYLATFPC